MSAPVPRWPLSAQGRVPERTALRPSAGRHAGARPYRGEPASGRPPTACGVKAQPPGPGPRSQSFSRGYGSVLPTSLTYINPLTRGCSPWRPDAVMSTTEREQYPLLQIFKDRRWRAGHREKCGALPASEPYLRMIRFQGLRAVKKKRELFPGPTPASLGSLTLPSAALSR